jgi:hypothetical protein
VDVRPVLRGANTPLGIYMGSVAAYSRWMEKTGRYVPIITGGGMTTGGLAIRVMGEIRTPASRPG